MMKRMLLAAAAVATLATMSFTAAPAEERGRFIHRFGVMYQWGALWSSWACWWSTASRGGRGERLRFHGVKVPVHAPSGG